MVASFLVVLMIASAPEHSNAPTRESMAGDATDSANNSAPASVGGSIYLTMPAVGYNASYASPGIKGGLILRGVGHRVGLALNGFLRAGDGAIWGGEINPFITFADLVDVGGFFLLGSSQDYHLSDPLFLEYGPMVQIYSPRVGVCRLGVYVRVAWVEAPRQMGDQGRHVEAGIGLLFF